MVVTRVLLLRHAQSTWNAVGRWQGWADPPLSDDGRAASCRAADDPRLEDVTVVVASDLLRARHTGELIATARGWPLPQTLPGLRERCSGRWTGLTRAEIDLGWPGALDRTPLPIPGGEAPALVVARALTALHRIAEDHPGEVVLAVSHGALIRFVEQHAGGPPASVPNLGGRWVEVSGAHLVLGPGAAPLTGAPLAGERAG